ncbi:MAG: SDR family oxidoreductase [Anaerolineae bacterium]|jgi:NAD(P)-dependent dehydrogenase (short-subunit alcohol dehydrogenase family)/rhamnose utilization protein RhaD (predicted bifunctional aldolase and dehydrogenase)
MRSDWNDQEAASTSGDVGQLAHASSLLFGAASIIVPGSGVSVKVGGKNLFGEEEQILHLHRFALGGRRIAAEDFFRVPVGPVARLTWLERLSDLQLVSYVERHSADVSALAVYREAVLHAVVPHRYVIHVYPDAVLAIANTAGGRERLSEACDEWVSVLPSSEAGLPLARLCRDAFSGEASDPSGLVMMQQGILGFGETAEAAYERVVKMINRAEKVLSEVEAKAALPSTISAPGRPLRQEIAMLREAVSSRQGFPVIVTVDTDPAWLAFAQREDRAALLMQRPPIAGVDLEIRWPPWPAGELEAQVEGSERRSASWPGIAPGALLDPELGMCAAGRTAAEAFGVADVYRHCRGIVLAAETLEAYRPALGSARREPEPTEAQMQTDPGMFAGEIALVTGAASGIGRSCVEAFLARGAAVVGLDVNPDISQMLDRDDFLGLECDVTDSDAVREALEATAKAFGGLDILVPNAGVFPPGCRIDSLSLDEWKTVMAVNLDANLTLMREAHPLLQASPRDGRVVIMGSRNVPAPGPGAVAYSASKAALVQMGRVAALEWGGDGIRVNIVNPHAVFDTGIWTDEVLQARADHYGLTVEQYKTRNVLGVEVTSRDVGELVAEMCGPLFAKTTGAQIPIDGGSDRVI